MQAFAQHIWVGLILLGVSSSAVAQIGSTKLGTRNPLRSGNVVPVQYSQLELMPAVPSASAELDPQALAPLSAQPQPVPAPGNVPSDLLSESMPVDPYSPDDPLSFSASGQGDGLYLEPTAAANLAPIQGASVASEPVWPGSLYEQLPLDGPARLFSTRDWFRTGRWYSHQEFVLLTRADMRNTPVVEDTTGPQAIAPNPTTGATEGVQPQLGTKSARFYYEPGLRVSLGRFFGRDFLNRDHALEFEFFGLFDMAGQASIGLENPEFFAQSQGIATLLGANLGTADGFTNGVSATIYHRSSFNSGEVNWRVMGRPREDRMVLQPDGEWVRHSSPTALKSFLAGFRYLSIDDSFTYAQFGQNAQTNNGLLQVETQNDLMGLQVGGRIAENYSTWEWGLDGKFAGLLSFVERTSAINTRVNNVAASRNQVLNDETLGLLFEAGIGGAYYIRPGLSVRTSYRMMYVMNIASAYENISLAASFTPLDASGEGLYHGLTTGLEWTW